MRERNGAGTQNVIHYGIGSTPIGEAFIAVSEKGLCTLHMIQSVDQASALRELAHKFPGSQLVESPARVAPVLRQVSDSLRGEHVEVRLDLRGTPFQQRVWRVLREIPRGTTCSYTELALRVGNPRAVRAVASACARNPVAVFVPCHRVLRRDGTIGGYRGGLDCKRELLRREQL